MRKMWKCFWRKWRNITGKLFNKPKGKKRIQLKIKCVSFNTHDSAVCNELLIWNWVYLQIAIISACMNEAPRLFETFNRKLNRVTQQFSGVESRYHKFIKIWHFHPLCRLFSQTCYELEPKSIRQLNYISYFLLKLFAIIFYDFLENEWSTEKDRHQPLSEFNLLCLQFVRSAKGKYFSNVRSSEYLN